MAIDAFTLRGTVDVDTDAAEGKLNRFSGALQSVAATAAGFVIGKALTELPNLLGNAVQAAADDAASMARLQQAVENTGVSWDNYGKQINDAISNGQKLAFSDDQVRNALSTLTAETGDAGKALSELGVAQDFARGAGIDLGTASKLLGKVTDDNIGVLKRYGIEVGKNATAQDLLNAVDKRYGGQAAKFAASGAGQWAILKDQLGEVEESLGYILLPLFTKLATAANTILIPALFAIVAALQPIFDTVTRVARALAGPIIAAGKRLITALTGPLNDAWVTLRDSVITFQEALTGNWTNAPGIRNVHRIVGQLGLLLHDTVVPAAQGLRDAFDKLAPKLQPVVRYGRDLLTVLSPLGTILKDALIGFGKDGLAGVLPGVTQGLKDVAGAFGDLGSGIKTAFQDIDWGSVASTIGDALSGALSGAVDVGGSIASSVADSLRGVDWGNVAGTVKDGIVGALTAVTGWGADIVSWFGTELSSVDWSAVGTTIKNGIETAVINVVGWGQDLVSWIIGVLTGVDWSAVGSAIKTGIVTAVTAVVGWGGDIAAWFKTEVTTTDWSGVAGSIVDALKKGVSAATGIADAIKTSISPPQVDYQATGVAIGNALGTGINAGVGQATQQQPQATGWFATFNQGAADVKRNFSDMATGIGNAFSGLSTLFQALQPEFNAVALAAGAAMVGLNAAAQLAVQGVGKWVGLIEEGIGKAGSFIGLEARLAGEGIDYLNTTVGPALLNFGQKVVDSGGTVQRWSDDVQGWFQTAADGIVGAIQGLPGDVAGIFETVKEGVSTALSTLVTDASGLAGTMATGILSALQSLPSDVTTLFTNAAEGVGTVLSTLVGTVTTYGGQIVGGFVGALQSVVSSATQPFTDALSAIEGLISGTDLSQLGSDLVQGLIDGINSMLGPLETAVDKIGGLLSKIDLPGWSPIPDAGEHMGQALVSGIAQGINDTLPLVGAAALNLGSALAHGVGSPITNLGGLIIGQITGLIPQMGDAASQLVPAFVDAITAGTVSLDDAAALFTQPMIDALKQLEQNLTVQLAEAWLTGADTGPLQDELKTIDDLLGSTAIQATQTATVTDGLTNALSQLGDTAGGTGITIVGGMNPGIVDLTETMGDATDAATDTAGAVDAVGIAANAAAEQARNLNGYLSASAILFGNVAAGATSLYDALHHSFTPGAPGTAPVGTVGVYSGAGSATVGGSSGGGGGSTGGGGGSSAFGDPYATAQVIAAAITRSLTGAPLPLARARR